MARKESRTLTHTRQAETAKPEEKKYSMKAGGGLSLIVMPNGTKKWQFRYRYLGDARTLSFGLFPVVGLAEAKSKRDHAKKLLIQGIDPSQKKQADKREAKQAQANSFEAVAMEWLARQTDKAGSTREKASWLLNFAIDDFGRLPIRDIKPSIVLETCRKKEKAGHCETAQRIRAKCSQVFRYAVGLGLIDSDPCRDLRGLIKQPEVKHRAAITDPAGVGKLLCDIDGYCGAPEVVAAMQLAALTFVRPGELRAARWRDIDMDAAQWSYTPPKTRKQTGVALLIPLPRQALCILQSLRAINGGDGYVFPGTGKEGYLSENAVLNALKRMGYNKVMTGHGFRATARTLLQERLRFPVDLIEMQLGHAVADVHGRAYNRTEFIEDRTAMMQRWADYLDELRVIARGENIIPTDFARRMV